MVSAEFAWNRLRVDEFYKGIGDVPDDQLDAWSIAAEEWGHMQNMFHFGSSLCDTMDGSSEKGTDCNRTLIQPEKNAAQEPYDLMHP